MKTWDALAKAAQGLIKIAWFLILIAAIASVFLLLYTNGSLPRSWSCLPISAPIASSQTISMVTQVITDTDHPYAIITTTLAEGNTAPKFTVITATGVISAQAVISTDLITTTVMSDTIGIVTTTTKVGFALSEDATISQTKNLSATSKLAVLLGTAPQPGTDSLGICRLISDNRARIGLIAILSIAMLIVYLLGELWKLLKPSIFPEKQPAPPPDGGEGEQG